MGLDKTQIDFPVSFIKAMSHEELPPERGLVLVDFPIREIDYRKRRTVKETYSQQDYASEYADYVIVADIVGCSEKLMVPPELGNCNFEQRQEPNKRPSPDHKNNPVITAMLKEH